MVDVPACSQGFGHQLFYCVHVRLTCFMILQPKCVDIFLLTGEFFLLLWFKYAIQDVLFINIHVCLFRENKYKYRQLKKYLELSMNG